MIVRALRLFSLLLFLLTLQWGGTAHALSHLDDDDHDRPHTPCELCVAYAALDHGLADTTAKPGGEGQTFCLTEIPAYRAPQCADARPYLSRAPPARLI